MSERHEFQASHDPLICGVCGQPEFSSLRGPDFYHVRRRTRRQPVTADQPAPDSRAPQTAAGRRLHEEALDFIAHVRGEMAQSAAGTVLDMLDEALPAIEAEAAEQARAASEAREAALRKMVDRFITTIGALDTVRYDQSLPMPNEWGPVISAVGIARLELSRLAATPDAAAREPGIDDDPDYFPNTDYERGYADGREDAPRIDWETMQPSAKAMLRHRLVEFLRGNLWLSAAPWPSGADALWPDRMADRLLPFIRREYARLASDPGAEPQP